jgi:hypothetical protein
MVASHALVQNLRQFRLSTPRLAALAIVGQVMIAARSGGGSESLSRMKAR